MAFPNIEVKSTLYLPDKSFHRVETEISDLENHAMDICFDYAQEALEDGNPPIGAVLLYHNPETRDSMHWAAKTQDKTTDHVFDHAETIAYFMAQPVVKNRLENCTLVTTAEPCGSICAGPYAAAKIGKILFAASRSLIYENTGLMRPREFNLHEILRIGNTNTVVTEGFRAHEALIKFFDWKRLRDEGLVAA